MYLRHLPIEEVQKAHDAAGYLLELPVRLDVELAIKLDTFRADVMVELEDREPADLAGHKTAKSTAE
jgi:hypothetical protein